MGGAITLQGGTSIGVIAGPALDILGGVAASGQTAGLINIKSGSDGAGTGSGGALTLSAGDSAGGAGGNFTITSGDVTSGLGDTGNITISAPDSPDGTDRSGGDVTIAAGNTGTRNAPGGVLDLSAGNSNGAGSQPAGDVIITAGNQINGATGGVGGNINLTPGTSATTTDGIVDLTRSGIQFQEQAARTSVPAAGKGQLWVRNDAPSVLVFTDDDGVDTSLGPKLSIVTFGSSTDTTTLGPANVYAATAGGITLTIQTATITEGGTHFFVKDTGGNAGTSPIVIATQAAETIDGLTSISIIADYGVALLFSDGTNLFTL